MNTYMWPWQIMRLNYPETPTTMSKKFVSPSGEQTFTFSPLPVHYLSRQRP